MLSVQTYNIFIILITNQRSITGTAALLRFSCFLFFNSDDLETVTRVMIMGEEERLDFKMVEQSPTLTVTSAFTVGLTQQTD